MSGTVRMKVVVGDRSWEGSVSYSESLKADIAIANAASDTSLAFGGVTTADVVFLISDQSITINLNSNSGTDITIDASKPFVIFGGAVTAIYVSNASGSTAHIEYELDGE